MSSNGSRWRGREVVIVEAARTPIGRGHAEKGAFGDVHPNALLGAAYQAVIEPAGIDAAIVEDVVAGAVSQVGEQSTTSPATHGSRPGFRSLRPRPRLIGSAVRDSMPWSFAAGLIAAGVHDVMVGAGVGHIGRVPTGSNIAHPEEFGTPSPPELMAPL
jgi:acetyl-CoA acyltransferase